jgi:hypothetical protein
MEKQLSLNGLLVGIRPATGKTGKVGYYVSAIADGQPATFFSSNPPALLNKMVKSDDDKTYVPKDVDTLPVSLIIGVRFFKGIPSLDLVRIEER